MVIPVVTPAQMAAIDAAAPEPVEVLIDRAGAAVARTALDLMDGTYGRRAVVLAGPGHNGDDGRAAATRLRRRGVRVRVVDAVAAARTDALLPPADLYVDAAFGTGLSRLYSPPPRSDPTAPVLAVDIPSGLDGLTGAMLAASPGAGPEHSGSLARAGAPAVAASPGAGAEPGSSAWAADRTVAASPGAGAEPGSSAWAADRTVAASLGAGPEQPGSAVWAADRTVTFAALKPGLLYGAGPALCGELAVADIGLDPAVEPACGLITDADVAPLPAGTNATHKWRSAVLVAAGSPGMAGAAALVCAAALRGGARMVHLCAPEPVAAQAPVEVVASVPPLDVPVERFCAAAVGPGLGADEQAAARLAEVLDLPIPVVVDADGLRLLARPELTARLRRRTAPTVLTPHDGEFAALTGSEPGPDRIAAARSAAADTGAVVLLKGGPTTVADPAGRVLIAAAGDARLATAGSGDVLTGMIAARLAAFAPADVSEVAWRTAEAAHLHGQAGAAAGPRPVAGDLLTALSDL